MNGLMGDTKFPDSSRKLISRLNSLGMYVWSLAQAGNAEICYPYTPSLNGIAYNRTLSRSLLRDKKLASSYFNGSSTYIEVLDNALLKPNTITVLSIANADFTNQLYPPIIKKAGATGYSLEFADNGTLAFWCNVSGVWKSSPTYALSVATTYFLVGVFDGSKVRLYVNGNEIGSGTSASGVISNTANNLRIGNAFDDASRVFKGLISVCGIAPFALSSQQIKNIYLYSR